MAPKNKQLDELLTVGLSRAQRQITASWVRVILLHAKVRNTSGMRSAAEALARELERDFAADLRRAHDPDSEQIVELCLPTNDHNKLIDAGIETIGQLRQRQRSLAELPQVGEDRAIAIRAALQKYDRHVAVIRREQRRRKSRPRYNGKRKATLPLFDG